MDGPPSASAADAGEESARLHACARGDRDALEWLFRTYRDRVYRVALHLAGNPSAAADVTQDVFLKLLTRLPQFRQEASFSTWLHRIVVNAALDRRKRERRLVGLDEAERSGARWAPPGQDQALERAERGRRVTRAMAGIREEFRVALALRYASDLSYEEMAAVLGVSPGTVASRLSRGLRDLARELAKEGP